MLTLLDLRQVPGSTELSQPGPRNVRARLLGLFVSDLLLHLHKAVVGVEAGIVHRFKSRAWWTTVVYIGNRAIGNRLGRLFWKLPKTSKFRPVLSKCNKKSLGYPQQIPVWALV